MFDLNRAGKVDDRSCGPYSENPGGVGRVRTGHGGTWKSGWLKEWRAQAVWARFEGTRQFDEEAQSQID
jgi:hypothetical protein